MSLAPSNIRSKLQEQVLYPETFPNPSIDSGLDEWPIPLHSSPVSPVRPTSAGRTSFVAFSSDRKFNHGVPIVQFPHSRQENAPDLSMPGGWPSDKV
ncbi:hypothetical protein PAXINDRAFT_171355, partial [Paxillus involutus ATCC 200175]